MKLFFKYLIYFFLAFTLFICINWFIERLIYKHANVALEPRITTVITGNSRLQMINPIWVPNTVNISKGGESYYFTYRTLSKLLNDNPGLKTVILSTSFDNFLFDYSHVIKNGNEYYSPEQLSHYIRVLTFDDLLHANYFDLNYLDIWLKKSYVPIDFENTLKIIIKFKFGYQGISQVPYYGNYHKSEKSKLSPQNIKDFTDKINSFEISPWNEKYFYAILNMCKEKHLKLFLVTTPFPENVHSKINPIFINNFSRIITNAKRINPNLNYLDFFKDTYPMHFYGDPHHLNSKGSKILAKKISSYMYTH